LALALCGCSIHPLPEDVSPASTFDIVERIRCEVWEGLQDFKPDDDRANEIIGTTAIGLDFDFTIEEKNKAASGKLEYKRAASKGQQKGFFLDLSSDAEGQRKNVRSFRTIDKLVELRAERGERCRKAAVAANGLYPITGDTGMAEVVRTYVKLEMLTKLGPTEGRGRVFDKGEVFSDELRFTTKLSAGANPTLELRTVAGDFRLSHTSIFGTASREDIHRVTVALSRGPAVRDVGLREGWLDDGHEIIRPYRSLRRLAQRQAVGPQTRVLLELQRRRNAREDERVVESILFGTE
jgi:hypothetical protein